MDLPGRIHFKQTPGHLNKISLHALLGTLPSLRIEPGKARVTRANIRHQSLLLTVGYQQAVVAGVAQGDKQPFTGTHDTFKDPYPMIRVHDIFSRPDIAVFTSYSIR